jgi:hypothetical protein
MPHLVKARQISRNFQIHTPEIEEQISKISDTRHRNIDVTAKIFRSGGL